MKYRPEQSLLATAFVLLVLVAGCRGPSGTIDGAWSLDKEASTDFDQWRALTISIRPTADGIFIRRDFNAGRYNRSDSTIYPTDGSTASTRRDASAKWLDSVHLGVFLEQGTTESTSARWTEEGRSFATTSTLPLTTSTGTAIVVTESEYELSRDGSTLTITQRRSTRDEPVVFVMRRAEP